MKLQACSKCGAQFDVSSFSAGFQFSCPCGEVLTAHAAAKPAARTPGTRRPGAQRGAGKAPAAPAPGGAPRRGAAKRTPGGPRKAVVGGPAAPSKGPQYQPVQRGAQGASAAPSTRRPAAGARRGGGRRGARGEDEQEGRGRRPAATGPNKAVLIGAAALVVVVVLLVVAMGGGEKDPVNGGPDVADNGASTGGPGVNQPVEPDEPRESLKEIMGDYAVNKPTLKPQYEKFINRLLALDGEDSKNGLRTVYRDYIEGPGRDDKDARKFLGYKEFTHDIPEDIANRDYPYLKAVSTAYRKQWFGPDEMDAYEIAMKAWKKTEEHRDKLISDHRFVAADEIRANLKKDPFFKDYNYTARWAEPYLICYSSKDRLSEYDLLAMEDPAERRKELARLAGKKEDFEKILDEKAVLFQSLYKEFMRRYEKSLRLKDLMDVYGGRPDYPVGYRTFANGVPLVIWIFDNRTAFDEYHSKVTKRPMHSGVAGYFSPQTTYVYLYDEAANPANRVFEINKNVHEGTHQLEFWFTRQRNKWRKPKFGQDFFGEGLAEYIGSVQLQKDSTLKFIGYNIPRLKNMQMLKKRFEKGGGEYKLFPVDKLVGFASYPEVQAWGRRTWEIDPGTVLGMFYQQSWAFVYFLNHYENGKYQKQFLKFFDLVLHREVGASEGDQAFKEAFRIRDEDDWEDLNDDFHDYIRDELMKLDARKWDYTPPPRGSVGRK